MTTESLPEQQNLTTRLITGIYWRKSLWNGAATIPVILGFENDQLVLKDGETVVFAAPISTVKAKVTLWGTLVLFVDGKKYDFVGTGSGISRTFSAEQQAEINDQSMTLPTTLTKAGLVTGLAGSVGRNLAGNSAGSTVGAAGQIAGGAAMAAGYLIGLNGIKKWQALFAERNLLSKGSKHVQRNVVLLMLAIFFGTIILSSIFSVLTEK